MLKTTNSIVALDVGGERIGVASANAVALIASPLTTVQHTQDIHASLKQLLDDQDAAVLVVGLPRSLSGDHTEQTRTVERFVERLQQDIDLPVYWQDEALTSKKAEAELEARKKPYAKGDIDALAATYILEDFLSEHPEVRA